MKKQLIIIILTLVMAILFSGCDIKANSADNADNIDNTDNAYTDVVGLPSMSDGDYGGDMPWEWICFSARSLDVFLAWVKSGGTEDFKTDSLQFPANQRFIEWTMKNKELAIPVLKNEAYQLHVVTLMAPRDGYRMVFFAPEAWRVPEYAQTASIIFIPLSEAEKEQSVEDVVKNYLKNFPDTKIDRGSSDSPWGEYWVIESTSSIFFIKVELSG